MMAKALVVLQMGGGGQMGNGMGPGGWGFGYGFVGLAVMLFLLGTVVYLLARAFSGASETRSEPMRTDTTRQTANRRTTAEESDDPALDELRERYARGEISDEEFERRAQRLRDDADTTH